MSPVGTVFQQSPYSLACPMFLLTQYMHDKVFHLFQGLGETESLLLVQLIFAFNNQTIDFWLTKTQVCPKLTLDIDKDTREILITRGVFGYLVSLPQVSYNPNS